MSFYCTRYSVPRKTYKFRLSRNSTKFNVVARFRETIPTNVTFPFGAEFPKDITKVFQLSGNELSSKHAQVSSSSERPSIDNFAIIPLKSFRSSAIDWPSLSFKFIGFRIKKIFAYVLFVSYMFSEFFQKVWGFVSLAT